MSNNKSRPESYGDKPSFLATLGARCVYTVIAWFILGLGIEPTQNFFVAVTLFAFPLLMDYLKFTPDSSLRKWIRRIGIALSTCWFVVGCLGMAGTLVVKSIKGELVLAMSNKHVIASQLSESGELFTIFFIWLIIGINPFLTIIDIIVFESPDEAGLKERVEAKFKEKTEASQVGLTDKELEG